MDSRKGRAADRILVMTLPRSVADVLSRHEQQWRWDRGAVVTSSKSPRRISSIPARSVVGPRSAMPPARSASTFASGSITGEVERRGTELAGIAVHLACRVCDTAHPGKVLVSRTVVDLVAGSGTTFDDRGEHELKGMPAPWRLLAVTT
jgi:class 3 adenylate cyclase